MNKGSNQRRKTFTLEVILMVILITIGVGYGAFEFWISKYADGEMFLKYGKEAFNKREYFKAKIWLKLLAKTKRGNEFAANRLTWIYLMEDNVPEALYWNKIVQKNGYTNNEILMALCLEKEGKYEQAAEVFYEKCRFSRVSLELEDLFRVLKSEFKINSATLIKNYIALSNQGNVKATFVAAAMFHADKNFVKAIEFYKKAHNNGVKHLAKVIAKNYKINNDYLKAIEWYKRALKEVSGYKEKYLKRKIAELELKIKKQRQQEKNLKTN